MIAGVLAAALAVFSHPLSANAAPTFDEVSHRLMTQGPRATVQALRTGGKFQFVLSRIGGGDRAWIGLVPQLAEGSDGAESEGLGIALAEALPKNARTVLAALDLKDGPVRGPQRVCSAPFIEPQPGVVARYKVAAMRAVMSNHQPALARAKAACLTRLQAIPG